ncbi:hypothetical protein DFP88_1143 [Pseudoroseicyclus aestuarii]|uniref:Uncharacterized protein n=1 Tax=Pseudoroseicyclus aestuarii TaxID=1795041 RepID=A0A318SM28_9RHOB|nr:hypothetical protein DFP88_1143 [Pseudoroseicyclus aestuarii]
MQEVQLHAGLIEILDLVRTRAHGDLRGVVFPSRRGKDQTFRNESLSMSLKRAGYDLTPLDFGRAHKHWTRHEGGGDLAAWSERLHRQRE